MGGTAFRLRSLWLGVVAPVALVGLGAPAQAQGIFCPSNVTGGATTLSSGFCTNGGIGAFSNAALASQALSDVTQASTDQSTNTAVEAISARRRTEEVQQQAPPAAPRERNLPPREPSRTPEKTEQLIYKAPIAPAPYEPHWGVWAEGFGDYDRLTGNRILQRRCCWGYWWYWWARYPDESQFHHQGNDWWICRGRRSHLPKFRTWRWYANNGNFDRVPMVKSQLIYNEFTRYSYPGRHRVWYPSGHLSGPSVGAYATYFLNGFSTDLTLKVDFLHLNETFTNSLAFSNGTNPVGTTFAAGAGSTNLTQYGIVWNVQQKIPLSNVSWIEPTVGLRYYIADYNSRCSPTRPGRRPPSSNAGRCASGYAVPLEQCRGHPDLDRARLRRSDRVRLRSNRRSFPRHGWRRRVCGDTGQSARPGHRRGQI